MQINRLFLLAFILFAIDNTALELDPQVVGIASFQTSDPSRHHRPINYDVWYPTKETKGSLCKDTFWVRPNEDKNFSLMSNDEKYPLVIFSHGNFADKHMSSWFAEALSANGFIVAAVDHYGATAWDPEVKESIAIWNRPLDLSFVIDDLHKQKRISPHINFEQIGVAGYSLGGMTAIWMMGDLKFNKSAAELALFHIATEEFSEDEALHALESTPLTPLFASYADHRIKAVFTMAPAGGSCFEISNFENITTPFYTVYGDADDDTPPKDNALWFSKHLKNAKSFSINGGNHYIFLNEVSDIGQWLLPDEICKESGKYSRKKTHQITSEEAIHFFSKHLKK